MLRSVVPGQGFETVHVTCTVQNNGRQFPVLRHPDMSSLLQRLLKKVTLRMHLPHVWQQHLTQTYTFHARAQASSKLVLEPRVQRDAVGRRCFGDFDTCDWLHEQQVSHLLGCSTHSGLGLSGCPPHIGADIRFLCTAEAGAACAGRQGPANHAVQRWLRRNAGWVEIPPNQAHPGLPCRSVRSAEELHTTTSACCLCSPRRSWGWAQSPKSEPCSKCLVISESISGLPRHCNDGHFLRGADDKVQIWILELSNCVLKASLVFEGFIGV